MVERDGGRRAIQAAAVVLASGGYEWNEQLRTRFLPGPLTHPHSPPANEGDGLLLAMEVGADLANMNETWWYPASSVPGEEYEGRPLARFVGVERTAPHSIIVDRFGDRFVNEAANYNDMQKAFFSFDANEYSTRHLPCWVVFDRQYRSRYPVVTVTARRPRSGVAAGPRNPRGSGRKGGDRPGRARRRRSSGGTGSSATGGTGTSGGGPAPTTASTGIPGAEHPNLGTIERGPVLRPPVHIGSVGTKGGPRVDGHGRVLHVRDRPIPGLYGAGNVVASPAGPAYYGGGTSIGMGMVWGHLAGAHAASFATGAGRHRGERTTVTGRPRPAVRRRMYELMALILACDERVRRGLSAGEFACTYWPATGQEAIAAAIGTVLRAPTTSW